MATSEQSFFPHWTVASPSGVSSAAEACEPLVRSRLGNPKGIVDWGQDCGAKSVQPKPSDRKVGICQSSQACPGEDLAGESCNDTRLTGTANFGTVTASFGTGTEACANSAPAATPRPVSVGSEPCSTGATTFGAGRGAVGVSLPPIASQQTEIALESACRGDPATSSADAGEEFDPLDLSSCHSAEALHSIMRNMRNGEGPGEEAVFASREVLLRIIKSLQAEKTALVERLRASTAECESLRAANLEKDQQLAELLKSGASSVQAAAPSEDLQ